MKLKYFAVVGNPITHSLSPRIHPIFAEQSGINLRYDKFCVETEGTAFCFNAKFIIAQINARLFSKY
nr:hypothetical protein [Gammaproteobacteria bacterium]